MNTLKTIPRRCFPARYLILIPHGDSLKSLEACRSRLFSSGFDGAHSFPACVPLARISRPFTKEELKALAHRLREECARGMGDGKFRTAPRLRRFNEDGGFSFWGLPLEPLALPAFESEKIIHPMEGFFLCAGIAGSRERTPALDILPISFRAARTANLAIRPLCQAAPAPQGGPPEAPAGRRRGAFPRDLFDGFSFEWNITDPVWLPAPGKRQPLRAAGFFIFSLRLCPALFHRR